LLAIAFLDFIVPEFTGHLLQGAPPETGWADKGAHTAEMTTRDACGQGRRGHSPGWLQWQTLHGHCSASTSEHREGRPDCNPPLEGEGGQHARMSHRCHSRDWRQRAPIVAARPFGFPAAREAPLRGPSAVGG